jgi:hypothetical protein
LNGVGILSNATIKQLSLPGTNDAGLATSDEIPYPQTTFTFSSAVKLGKITHLRVSEVHLTHLALPFLTIAAIRPF